MLLGGKFVWSTQIEDTADCDAEPDRGYAGARAEMKYFSVQSLLQSMTEAEEFALI
jgi:hypothetical protein